MATLQTWRKAYGALKDHTTLSLAQINSDYKDLDVAIVKATNHVECPPKDRHLRKILIATSAIRPRADVAYCIHALARRLGKTRNWTVTFKPCCISKSRIHFLYLHCGQVALKTLIVIHRLLREGDPTFKEELINFSERGLIPHLSNFKDDSSPIAWDCSAWVRTYAQFLEERLECFRVLKYDIETRRVQRSSQEPDMSHSITRDLDNEQLLEQLPSLQQLMYRLVGCRPEGAAVRNYVIQYALALVLKESFKIYCAINDGVINLIDKFFEMPRHEAVKAVDVYRRSSQQAGSLIDFYEVCKELELARNFQFPVLREPPSTFLETMEEYVSEAPRVVSVPTQQLEFTERLQLTYHPDQSVPDNDNESTIEETYPEDSDSIAASRIEIAPVTPTNNVESADFLGLNDTSPSASTIEYSNASALAIVPTDSTSNSSSGATAFNSFDPTGWELALVTAPSSDISAPVERQLAGGMDSLTLNSLYDEASYRASNQRQPIYGSPAPNPFEMQDPFVMSSNIATPVPVQMASMSQQQMNPWGPYPGPYSQVQQHPAMGSTNPFGDPVFGTFPSHNSAFHPQTTNPFGSTGLL
ncbi:hypothetical protein V2J09_020582 [Rumex salicifolius]